MGTEAAQQADDQVTLEDALDAAWSASEEPEEEVATEETEEVESEEATPPEEEAGGESEPDEGEPETQEEEAGAEDSESAEPTVEPPQDWPQEWADRFRQIPTDEGRNILLDAYKNQQADYTRKTQEIAEIRKAIPDETREQLSLNGMTEGQYVRQLAAADKYLREKPAEAIKWLANNYGVELGNLDEGDEYTDPHVSQLQQKIQSLEQRLQQRDQQEQQSQQQQLNSQIQEFASATDEQGQPKHPDFEKLKPAMAGLLQTGYAQTLEDAYEQAAWADPDVRQRRLEAQQRQVEEKTTQQRKKKASKAKQAHTPASSGSEAEPKEEAGDLRSELEKHFDEQQ